jgi:site-specific DNA recombinase
MRKKFAKPVRCAIYTRVSTDQGLEQDFNSLDAQYDASQAYIRSQAHAGWSLLRAKYEDGGFSGGNIDRPALRRLLDDVRAGKIDVIVVYKVDRLTRSLTDFAKLVELFDQHNVSFVSVTQQFNTTTSMGRLTLNVLLCPIRARGHLRAYPRQDCRLQTQGSLGRRHGAARLRHQGSQDIGQ